MASTVSKALRTALDVSIEWHSSQESADSLDDSDIDAGICPTILSGCQTM